MVFIIMILRISVIIFIYSALELCYINQNLLIPVCIFAYLLAYSQRGSNGHNTIFICKIKKTILFCIF